MTIEQALEIKQNWTSEQAKNNLEKLLLRGEQPADIDKQGDRAAVYYAVAEVQGL